MPTHLLAPTEQRFFALEHRTHAKGEANTHPEGELVALADLVEDDPVDLLAVEMWSALGGSMAPRFIMPKFMETTALFTFNGWALDGFLKVFWYGDRAATIAQMLTSLVPQLAMLSALAAVFLVAARTLARRWEAV